MQYRNGKEILPEKLLKELQKYIQGELVYIPREETTRKAWGENNGTRASIRNRNIEIYRLYKQGFSVEELMSSYNLSEDSIRKIVCKVNKDLSTSSVTREALNI